MLTNILVYYLMYAYFSLLLLLKLVYHNKKRLFNNFITIMIKIFYIKNKNTINSIIVKIFKAKKTY